MVVSLFIFNSKAMEKPLHNKSGFLSTLWQRYVLIRVIAFFLLLFVLDLAVGNILRKAYFSQKYGVLSRITYAIDKTTAEGLVMGSSRASHHFITDSLTSFKKMPFYNTGKDGQSIFYHYAILKCVLERYTPKVIVLDLLNDELYEKTESYDRLSELLPYCRDHAALSFVEPLRGPYEKFKMQSQIYPFNSLLISIAGGNSSISKNRFVEHNGYLPLFGEFKGNLNGPQPKIEKQIDPQKLAVYHSFIKDCKAHNIKLYITISPYLKVLPANSSMEIIEQIARKNNVPFYNFSNDGHFVQHRNFFWDPGHLNNEGALLFTKLISETII
jgi:hypothetical protein